MAEAPAEQVDPEVVGELGVAHGDVAGDAFAEPEAAEDAQRPGELLLAVESLVLDGLEGRRPGELHAFGVSGTPSMVVHDVGLASPCPLVKCSMSAMRQRYPSVLSFDVSPDEPGDPDGQTRSDGHDRMP